MKEKQWMTLPVCTWKKGFEGDGTQSETGLKWFPNSMEIFMTLVVPISRKGCCNSGLTP